MPTSTLPSAKKATPVKAAAPAKKPVAVATAAPRPAAKPVQAKAAPAKAAPAKTVAAKAAPVPPAAASKASAAAKPSKVEKHRKKLVRDSFTMPADDFALIASLKERALNAKRPAKKSELLRAGLKALSTLKAADLVAALDALATVKTGRPAKD